MPSVRRCLPAGLVALALLAGCSGSDAGSDADAPPPSGTSSAPDAESAFHEQEIAFEPCETPPPAPGVEAPDIEVECGTLTVPLDHAEPDGETAEIAMLRVPARGDDPIGSLVLNPGGPGFPGTSFAPLMAGVWAESPVTERFDLIGFDPRGVGSSTPAVDCYTDQEREDDALLSAFDGGVLTWTEETAAQTYEACAAGSGGAEVLDHLGTRDVAQDLDIMRAALGDEGLSFLGASYGTRLGAVYAEMFPENVRALVLDAAMDPLIGSHERRVQQFTAIQASFDQMAAMCAEDADCPLGEDPEQAVERYQELAQPLIEEPVPAGDGRELSFNKANGGIVAGMYNAESWPVVIEGIAELEEGRGDTLLALSDGYQGRSQDGVYADHLEATFAINCLDEDRLEPAQVKDLKQDSFAAAPFLDTGRPVEEGQDACTQWPGDSTLKAPYATDIEGLPDTLTVSTTGDALTPHEGGISLAETLGGSLLTVEGDQHGATAADNACIQDAVAAYLVDLESPAEDATCRL